MTIQRYSGRYLNGKSVTHPEIGYNLSPERGREIKLVNELVRFGFSLKQISAHTGISQGKVNRRYYGDAVNCLSYKQMEELSPRLKPIEILRKSERPARDGEKVTHYKENHMYETTINIVREAEDHEITDTMPMPLISEEVTVSGEFDHEIDLGRGGLYYRGERIKESSIKHTKLDPTPMTITYSAGKKMPSVSVMYRGACCDI